MLAYVCKYVPIEIFEGMGEEIERIEPQVINFNQADTLMHPNICSFVKGTLEEFLNKEYDGIILTSCCDSIKRLYDVLKEQCHNKFIYILDVPRKVNEYSVTLYEKRILEMVKAYEDFSGKNFDENKVKEVIKKEIILKEKDKDNSKLKIGILGARANDSIISIIENSNAKVSFNLTCTGIDRKFDIRNDDILDSYVSSLLNQIPCMRMKEAENRDKYVQRLEEDIDGIIYHTVQFCDNYSYEYTWLKEKKNTPMLLLETDCTKQSGGQIRTRIEAFLESLAVSKGVTKDVSKVNNKKSRDIYVLGVDSGSTSTNAVIMNQDKEIVSYEVIRTGAKSIESAQKILDEILQKSNLRREDISLIVSTGYGRVSIPYADEAVTEISCHGKGAHYFNPKIRTILDIGGQDSKAIKLNENGEVEDFAMNDKCAAGTGRFLEMMARTLEIDISELGPISLKWNEDVEITSMCSVFAESEVISLIAQNKEKSDIAHGVHKAIASKGYSLLKRVGLKGDYMMTGGVAKNPGVVKAVEEKIKDKLYICDEPEIVGATGAALYALEKVMIKV